MSAMLASLVSANAQDKIHLYNGDVLDGYIYNDNEELIRKRLEKIYDERSLGKSTDQDYSAIVEDKMKNERREKFLFYYTIDGADTMRMIVHKKEVAYVHMHYTGTDQIPGLRGKWTLLKDRAPRYQPDIRNRFYIGAGLALYSFFPSDFHVTYVAKYTHFTGRRTGFGLYARYHDWAKYEFTDGLHVQEIYLIPYYTDRRFVNNANMFFNTEVGLGASARMSRYWKSEPIYRYDFNIMFGLSAEFLLSKGGGTAIDIGLNALVGRRYAGLGLTAGFKFGK